MSTIHIPPHLRNGLKQDEDISVHTYDTVPLLFFNDGIEGLRADSTRLAPFFSIVNARFVDINWSFFTDQSNTDRRSLLMMLWAAGFFTTNKLNSFVVSHADNPDTLHESCVSDMGLFFAEDRRAEAIEYKNIAIPLMEDNDRRRLTTRMRSTLLLPDFVLPQSPPSHLEVFQCIELPRYVMIGSVKS